MNYKMNTTDPRFIFAALVKGHIDPSEVSSEFDLLVASQTRMGYLKADRTGRLAFTGGLSPHRDGRARVWYMFQRALDVASDNAEECC